MESPETDSSFCSRLSAVATSLARRSLFGCVPVRVNSPRKFEPHPPSQDRETRKRDERKHTTQIPECSGERRRCKKTTPSLHYTGLLDNPFSNLELRNLTLTWKRGEASRWRALLSPKSSERLVRHARARIPNDVRVREGDYFVGSRPPQTQVRKRSTREGGTKRNKLTYRKEPAGTENPIFWSLVLVA